MIGLVPVVAMLLAGSVPWTHDYQKAFADAEEGRRPVLVFFRTDCGGGRAPVNPMAGGPVDHDDVLSDCDLMQRDVWENAGIIDAAQRFVPAVVDGGDRTLQTRYQAVRMPTTLVTDPWGNEIFRSTGYIPRDKIERILRAVPGDFAALAPAGRVLRGNPTDFGALFAAGRFYEDASLPQVSERLYATALASPGSVDLTARREAVIARGLNLLAHLAQPAEAATVFEKELAASPEGPGSDALLLGLVNAHLQGGRRKEAEAALKSLEKGWPGSPYAARARQNLEGAKK